MILDLGCHDDWRGLAAMEEQIARRSVGDLAANPMEPARFVGRIGPGGVDQDAAVAALGARFFSPFILHGQMVIAVFLVGRQRPEYLARDMELLILDG